MKCFALLPLTALALAAACSENPTAATAPEEALAGKTSPTTVPSASGPVYVDGRFTMTYNATPVLEGLQPGQNGHPQAGSLAGGTCRQADGTISPTESDNTTWYNGAGNQTNAPFCQGSGETTDPQPVTVTCTITRLQATYAFGGTGQPVGFQTKDNELLNALTDGLELQSNNRIHYQAKKGQTNGLGSLVVGYTCVLQGTSTPDVAGSVTLNLAFVSQENRFEPFKAGEADAGRQIKGVAITTDVQGTDGNYDELMDLSWTFRSRNGIPLTEHTLY